MKTTIKSIITRVVALALTFITGSALATTIVNGNIVTITCANSEQDNGNCGYTADTDKLRIPASDALPAGTQVRIDSIAIAKCDTEEVVNLKLTIDGKSFTSATLDNTVTWSWKSGSTRTRLTYRFEDGPVLTVGTTYTSAIKYLKNDGSDGRCRFCATSAGTVANDAVLLAHHNGYYPAHVVTGTIVRDGEADDGFEVGSGMAINFRDSSGKLGDSDEAGISGLTIKGNVWNNSNDAVGSANAKIYAPGGSTTLDNTMPISWTSKNTWEWTGATTSYLKGYLDDGDNNNKTSISATVPFDFYDLYIVCATDTDSSTFSPKTVNGVKYTADESGKAIIGTSGWGLSRQSTPILGKNVMRVEGLTSHDLTIFAPRENGRGCIAAIVIVKVAVAKTTLTASELPINWSNISWADGIEPSADIPVEITFENGASLNIDKDISAKTIVLKGAVAISAGAYTYPAPDASSATSLTVNGGTVEFAALPSSNITIVEGATLKFDVSTATTINGIAGAGTFVKTGSAELTLNNKAGEYAIDGTTIQIEGGNIKLNCGVNGYGAHGNNADAKIKDATFVLGDNSNAIPITQYGWYDFYGTTTFENASDKTIFNGGKFRVYEGFKLIKRGAGKPKRLWEHLRE